MDDKNLLKTLKIDPLDIAEKTTGQSYKEDKETSCLGLALHIQKGKVLKKELESRNDSYHRMDLLEFVCIMTNVGFQQIYKEEIPKEQRQYTTETDYLYIFLRKEKGQLLIFDTYTGNMINGGNVYYNFKPCESRKFYSHISSGSLFIVDKNLKNQSNKMIVDSHKVFLNSSYDSNEYKKQREKENELHNLIYKQGGYVWSGDHDCREAILFNLAQLENYGEFIYPWLERPTMYHLSCGDGCEERIKALPEDVRKNLLL